MPALIWIMAWWRTGAKSFSEPMISWFTEANMRHSVSRIIYRIKCAREDAVDHIVGLIGSVLVNWYFIVTHTYFHIYRHISYSTLSIAYVSLIKVIKTTEWVERSLLHNGRLVSLHRCHWCNPDGYGWIELYQTYKVNRTNFVGNQPKYYIFDTNCD